eukprot:c8881_g1_i2.p1 GENE.c8881_g1_i2~~c8881_g1_i2.p1  ORF type:complete len:410 (+),score=91.95 c8881_g1_i2:39-1268(+)
MRTMEAELEAVLQLDVDLKTEGQEVSIQSSDGQVFRISRDCAQMSVFLAKAIRENANYLIVLPNISGIVLKRVLCFCIFHCRLRQYQDTRPIPDEQVQEISASWDSAFVDLEPKVLCEVASAAYYLDVKPLVNLTCRAIATLISDKSTDEIRRTFGIPEDMIPRENIANVCSGQNQSKCVVCERARQRELIARGRVPAAAPVDDRPLELLLDYINENHHCSPHVTCKKKKQKRKKARATSFDLPELISPQTTTTTDQLLLADEPPNLIDVPFESQQQQVDVVPAQSATTDDNSQNVLETMTAPHTPTIVANLSVEELPPQVVPDIEHKSIVQSNHTQDIRPHSSTKTKTKSKSTAKRRSDLNIGFEPEDVVDDPIDREVEEFAKRLEAMNVSCTKPKLKPSVQLRTVAK